MTWADRTSYLCKKMNTAIQQIRKVGRQMPPATATAAVQSIAIAWVYYCTSVWSTAGKTKLRWLGTEGHKPRGTPKVQQLLHCI